VAREKPIKLNFTKAALAQLVPTDRRVVYHDTATQGLQLRVEPLRWDEAGNKVGGSKNFVWLRKVNGTVKFKSIGTFPDLTVEQARGKAAEQNSRSATWKTNGFNGDDPFKHPGGLTLGGLLTEYVEHHVKNHAANPERAVPETEGMVKYLPTLKDRRLGMIRRADILRLHEDIGRDRGHVIANRVVEFIKRLFNWAVETERYNGQNPAENIQRFHEEKRKRYLQRDEAGRLLRALRTEAHADLRDFILLALMTGARKRDIFSMRWQDVFLDAACWVVPKPKNREPYPVPLMPRAVKVLQHRLEKRKENNPWVFPTTAAKSKKGYLQGIKKPWKRLRDDVQIPDITMHDLRRTLGSWQAERNVSLKIIGTSLGHRSTASTNVYAHLQLDPVRDAVSLATDAMLAEAKKKPKQLKAGK